MKLFYNKYRELKQENIDESVKLNSENRKKIERMMNYMVSNNISLFEIEILKKDLIGRAIKAENMEINLEDQLGKDQKRFCDSLITSGMKKNYLDLLLLFVRDMMLAIAIFNTIIFVLLGAPREYGIMVGVLLFAGIFAGLMQFVEMKMKAKLGYSKDGKNSKRKVEIFLFVLWFICLLATKRYNMFDTVVLEGNGWGMTSGLLAIAVMVELLNNLYWNAQSKKFN